MEKSEIATIPHERITNKIYLIRAKKIMLDRDLAELYKVSTKRLNEQVKRNFKRFPEDFMFQLNKDEMENWKSQIATSNSEKMGLRKLPFAFTEQGIAMLSGVLNSDIAIHVHIQIIRTFAKLRELMATNQLLRQKIEEVERTNDRRYVSVFRQLKYLLDAEDRRAQEPPKDEIGFRG
ncbi:MAG: DNA-binding protein [Candidatus Kerfeldbacteria bacterium RIFCSPHIGHO2_12_FULL_48_17]|uniref:DNA-binding protein n=1 Tax=Candidatus Kerfeldbacteria bacterium RIFCSPHIGHO2_12_FULL_48_17 TaxID=1798542 RepID=A0A1G2AZY4_9BACT|nr:MAG: DNA-binding protein [Candidatus Kerfeldbacteria bacterium RIFCSPHIGHO2_12_FULL_48_17]